MTDQGRSFDTVRIDALVCGPGFQERMAEPRVIEIAERIASGRDVATPIVRAVDMQVIAGEDVVAAFCLLDGVELEVELVHDGSFDDELPTELSPDSETRYGLGVAAAAAERTELTPVPAEPYRPLVPAINETFSNIPSPDGPTRETLDRARESLARVMANASRANEAERTELTPVPFHTPEEWEAMNREVEARLLASGAWQEPDPLGLRPTQSSQRETLERVEALAAQGVTQKAAVAAVAAETGKTEHAVKKAANRARRAKDKVSIETWGRSQPEAWMAATSELRRTMTNASNAIRTAMSALSPLVGSSTVPGANFVATHGELKDHARRLRELRPACVCAWCKNEPALVVRCVACGGRGWLGEKAMSLVPKELFPAGSAMAQGRAVELPKRDILDELQEVEGGPPLGSYGPEGGADHGEMGPPELPESPYSETDSVPLESRSHTVEPATKEQAEAAWQALEKANGGEAFLDDAVFEDVADDGDVW